MLMELQQSYSDQLQTYSDQKFFTECPASQGPRSGKPAALLLDQPADRLQLWDTVVGLI